MAKADLTPERLKELLNYDPGTGAFTWKQHRGVKAGKTAGSLAEGYVLIRLDYKLQKAHRLAWLYVHGVLPSGDIDHINGDRADNRIANLRDVSRSVNLQNQRSAHPNNRHGRMGATFHSYSGLWRAGIQVDGKHVPLGYFKTAEEASQAYVVAKRRLHEGCTI